MKVRITYHDGCLQDRCPMTWPRSMIHGDDVAFDVGIRNDLHPDVVEFCRMTQYGRDKPAMRKLHDGVGHDLDHRHHERLTREDERANTMDTQRKFTHETIPIEGEVCGKVPVQANGTLAGRFFYFRARWSSWTFEMWPEGPAAGRELPDGPSEWSTEGEWGDDPVAAGWMPHDDAVAIILGCARRWIEEASG